MPCTQTAISLRSIATGKGHVMCFYVIIFFNLIQKREEK